MNCKDCHYFKETQPSGQGDCRYNAPVRLVDGEGGILHPWPAVKPEDSCGKFERRMTRDESLKQYAF